MKIVLTSKNAKRPKKGNPGLSLVLGGRLATVSEESSGSALADAQFPAPRPEAFPEIAPK